MRVFLEFASRGKNAWWRYVVACVGAFPIAVLLTIGAVTGLRVLGVPTSRMIAALKNTGGTDFWVAAGLTFGTLLIAFAIAIAVVQHKSPGDVIGRWRWSMFAFGAGAWLAFSCVSALLDFLIEPRGFAFSMSGATPLFAFSALATLTIQTFAEEFIFRGYLTQGILLADFVEQVRC